MYHHFLGRSCALIAALVWAFSVIIFRKRSVDASPELLCFIRNFLTLLLMGGACLFYPGSCELLSTLSPQQMLMLSISGVIGIAIADSFFFLAIKNLDASIFAIFQCGYSPSVILLSSLFLGESLIAQQWLGLFLILFSIILISYSSKTSTHHFSLVGASAALLTVISNAVSVVIVKPTLTNLPLIPTVTIRLFFGTLALALYLLCFKKLHKESINKITSVARLLFLPTILGSFLGTFFWLAGFKFTFASIASVLNETSSLFIMILGVLLLKEPFTRNKIIALLIALVGVLLVLLT